MKDPSTPSTKRVAKAIHKVSGNSHINDIMTLSTLFLVTPDMSFTNQDLNLLDSNDQHILTPDDDSNDQQIRCICGFNHESQTMIQCDSCQKWFHTECIHLDGPSKVGFICIYCQYKISKAIKSYIRNEFLQFIPYLNQYNTIWNDIHSKGGEIQAVLELIPDFLPNFFPNEDNNSENYSITGSSEEL